MKNLLFKNITSEDRRQKKLSSSELIEQEGLCTTINRHMVCKVENVKSQNAVLERPNLYVFKRRDTKLSREEFYCRIKGQLYCASEDKIYLVSFINSLRIQLKRCQ